PASTCVVSRLCARLWMPGVVSWQPVWVCSPSATASCGKRNKRLVSTTPNTLNGSNSTSASPGGSAGSEPRRNALMWAVTILLTLAVCTGIGELAGRLAHVQTFRVRQQEYIGWAKPDPVLGWRNNPGVHRADESPHEPMTFLSDGSRDSGTPAQASGRPVIIIGCSFAE